MPLAKPIKDYDRFTVTRYELYELYALWQNEYPEGIGVERSVELKRKIADEALDNMSVQQVLWVIKRFEEEHEKIKKSHE